MQRKEKCLYDENMFSRADMALYFLWFENCFT